MINNCFLKVKLLLLFDIFAKKVMRALLGLEESEGTHLLLLEVLNFFTITKHDSNSENRIKYKCR